MSTVTELIQHQLPVTQVCEALGVSRSTYYRAQQAQPVGTTRPSDELQPRTKPTWALSEEERMFVRNLLNSERFMDQSPYEVYATLLDEGQYYCSIRSMYRVLAENAQVRERRNQLRHPTYTKPQLLATAPNQLWSWDITKLRTPAKWVYYYLYVLLDVFSRYVTGWMVAESESAALAEQLIKESCRRQQIQRDQLTLHADRGAPMIAKTLAQLLIDLGVDKTHSHPHTPNDNPFSEALFKTVKYQPHFPTLFGSVQDARAWGRTFFPWYNQEHHHTGIALLTPADLHFGRANEVVAQRQAVLQAAYEQHPERFLNGPPVAPQPPQAVWINPPKVEDEEPMNLP
jgi:putative transposase